MRPIETINKSATIRKGEAPAEDELALINAQALRPLSAEEVFTFRLAACDNQVDRDHERFTDEALEEMVKAFPGKPVLRDHFWSKSAQTARIYAAGVEQDGEVKRLMLRCYMPRTAGSAETITAIESGVVRECSVALSLEHSICSICGTDQSESICRHWGGRTYDGKVCHFDLSGVRDAYEVSLVAVPAQPEAGIVKSKRYGGEEKAPEPDAAVEKARARIKMERARY